MAPQPAVAQATIDFFNRLRPTHANAAANFDPGTVAGDARATRVVVHARYPQLVEDFLAFKRERGCPAERALYHAGWAWRDQVARLLARRPLAFLNPTDHTVLRTGETVDCAARAWDLVGTPEEGTVADPAAAAALRLRDYLSYDEALLGSLLGVSGPSHFINDGGRHNRGVPGEPGTFEPRGVIVGLAGPRFERRGRMDWHLAVNSGNLPGPLAAAYRRFLGCELAPGTLHQDGAKTAVLSERAYGARVRVTAELLLAEAADRAAQAGAGVQAHVYVVGLGLGVWKIDDRQPDLYVAAFERALKGLAPPARARVGVVEFGYVGGTVSAAVRDSVVATGKKYEPRVDVVFSTRNPAAKLPPGSSPRRLLVLSYAWDGNAFPGNEYWMRMVAASGDPAAACMSTIADLHNPLLNPGYLERIAVLGPWGGSLS
ncbi:hypothetical protein GGTG_00596 [Gaeumannomyces tritici R3-111a-1]|uniref:Uncharacterized protein n=1 Tax=Gaeumannomyces tritici (strain R3-111a-1) TaxID=644352 RepID=J3NH58_GAET3|nr:hypothetical protein GGTG_00596 [Gaeumannomyces tritici R3-111a-1]EJT80601.1 hypothetical protein GGTG_00596 [Gaeumannomyces tritici R3-111a-1]